MQPTVTSESDPMIAVPFKVCPVSAIEVSPQRTSTSGVGNWSTRSAMPSPSGETARFLNEAQTERYQ